MTRKLKLLLFVLSFPLILAGCQTTDNQVSERIIVPCSTLSYDFSIGFKSGDVCITYSDPGNRTDVERIVYLSNSHAILVDLLKYKNNNFYETAERRIRNANTYDFGKPFTSSAKNTDVEEAKKFLANMEFKFLDSNDVKKYAFWTAKTSAMGNTYSGYSFLMLVTRGDKKYQLVGFYMENTDTPMKREHFETVLETFKFKGETDSEVANSDRIEKRLRKLKSLLENGLITKSEAMEKRKKILNSL